MLYEVITRSLRTTFEFMFKRNGNGSVILISSNNISEGKSFVSLNLAASFAQKGSRTVVLGYDLRKPKVNRNNFV